MIELIKDVIRALQVLPKSNRTLHNIAIWCNPNHIKGSDTKIREKIEKILMNLKSKNKLSQERIIVLKQKRIIYNLIKNNHKSKLKVYFSTFLKKMGIIILKRNKSA